MADRKKLLLELNQPVLLELLYDNPIIGSSQYNGVQYYLYVIKNGSDNLNFYAPAEVHEKLKELKKGDKVTITKVAEREQKGSKVVIKYDVVVQHTAPDMKPVLPVNDANLDNLYEIMLRSCKDAVRIQTELGGLLDPRSLAVSIFIARCKLNGIGQGT